MACTSGGTADVVQTMKGAGSVAFDLIDLHNPFHLLSLIDRSGRAQVWNGQGIEMQTPDLPIIVFDVCLYN